MQFVFTSALTLESIKTYIYIYIFFGIKILKTQLY